MRKSLFLAGIIIALAALLVLPAGATTDTSSVPLPQRPGTTSVGASTGSVGANTGSVGASTGSSTGSSGWSVSPGQTTTGLNLNMGGLLGNGRTIFDVNVLGARKDVKYSLLEGNIARTEGEKGKLRYFGTTDYFAGFRGTGWAALGASFIKGDYVPPELNVPSLAGKTYVVYDTETTGFSPKKGNEVVQISAVKVKDGQIIDRFNSFVKPRNGIRNSRFHGIWWKDVKDSPRMEEVLPKFKEFTGDAPLVGHNEQFDRRFINHAHEKQYGTPMPNKSIDTLKLARKHLPGLKNHKLNTVAGHYGIKNPQAHRADADTETTAKSFVAMEKEKHQQAVTAGTAQKPGERWRSLIGGQVGVNAFLGPEISASGGTDYTDDKGRTYFAGTRGALQLGGIARGRSYAGLLDGKATVGARGDAFAGVRATGSLSGGIQYKGVGVELTGYGHVGAGLGATGVAEVQLGWDGVSFHIDNQLYCKLGGGLGLSGNIRWGEPPPALKNIVIATGKGIKKVADGVKETAASAADRITSATERFLSSKQVTTQ